MSIFWQIYIIARLLQGLAAMVINLFTLICVMTQDCLRSSANLLVASLALSDFLHGLLTSMILPFMYYSTSWWYYRPACLAGVSIEVQSLFCQFITFSMLAFERRNSLLFQLNRSKRWSRDVVLMVVILAWVTIALYNIAMAIFSASTLVIPEGTNCNVINHFPAFFTYIAFSIYLIATVMTFVGYGHIAWIAYRSKRQVNPGQSAMQQTNRKKDMSITKMMALVVGVFFILYFPFTVITVTLTPTSPKWHQVLFNVSILACDMNFWINPFIYAWRDKGFKKVFSKAISVCRRKCCCFPPLLGPGVSAVTNATVPTGRTMGESGSASVGSGLPVTVTVTHLVGRDP